MATDKTPPLGLALSGDFDSPAAVLASDLDTNAKVQILETWLAELEAVPGKEGADLRSEVEEARAKLPRTRNRDL